MLGSATAQSFVVAPRVAPPGCSIFPPNVGACISGGPSTLSSLLASLACTVLCCGCRSCTDSTVAAAGIAAAVLASKALWAARSPSALDSALVLRCLWHTHTENNKCPVVVLCCYLCYLHRSSIASFYQNDGPAGLLGGQMRRRRACFVVSGLGSGVPFTTTTCGLSPPCKAGVRIVCFAAVRGWLSRGSRTACSEGCIGGASQPRCSKLLQRSAKATAIWSTTSSKNMLATWHVGEP